MDKIDMAEVNRGDLIHFKYKNWKGVTSERKAIVNGIFWGSTEYHKENQFLLKGFDLDKMEERDYALRDVEEVLTIYGIEHRQDK
jgi:hypothetical protein